MKISIVIPNFNGAQLLERNLPKILDAVGDTETIVIDDASTDTSRDILKTQFPQVKVITRRKNEGFASTVNDGVKNASGDLILLLNSDIIPEPDFIKYLVFHFGDPAVFAVGCLQKCKENGHIILRGRGVGKFRGGFLIHARGAVNCKDTSEDFSNTLWVSGGAGMFRKSIWDKVGGLNTLYNPFYWEDIDLSYRALKAGYKLIFEAKSIVIHNQTQGAIRSSYSPAYVNTIAYRNQILFVWLNITDLSFMLNHLLYLPIHLVKALISLNGAYLTGFILAFLKIPSVLVKRNKNRKLFTVSDKKILASYPS